MTASKSAGNYVDWFKKAEEDEISTRAVLKEGSPSTACFLSQQMAEKYLKGLLVFHGKEFQKVHDLAYLETLLLEVEPTIIQISDDLALLTDYSLKTRYPADQEEFSFQEAKEAYESALRVKSFVLERVDFK